ncbi:MAG: T9SS type A sorting domain-containing protein [Bacteroidetes bacterium]|nr:T9SS type A sorting domain-containing protein [Bacteroidota bacterium]
MKKVFLLFVFYSLFFTCSAQGVWTQKADFGGGPRHLAVGFSIGNKGYIGTGYDGNGIHHKDFWEWDHATNIWTQKASFGGSARLGAVGFSIGTKGYIGTGADSIVGRTSDFWEWSQATNIWTQKANFGGTARYYAVGFSIGKKGYIGTGDDGIETKDFWEWDGDTASPTYNTWTQKADLGLQTEREWAVGFSIGTKGYIGTGLSGSNSGNDLLEYDPSKNIWTQQAVFGLMGRDAAVGFSIGTKGYIGVGENYTIPLLLQDFWEWDGDTASPAYNTWTQKSNFGGTARIYAVGFSIGNKGYIGTGMDANASRQDFWEYCDTCTVGVNELHNLISISVFPNPASELLHVTANGIRNTFKIEIYNVRGEKVYEDKNGKSKQIVIDIKKIDSGIYFCKLTDMENCISEAEKFIVTK